MRLLVKQQSIQYPGKEKKLAAFIFAMALLVISLIGPGASILAKNAPAQSLLQQKSASQNKQPPTNAEICYLLNRTTFGIRPGDIETVKAMGIGNFLNQQLNPQAIPESNMVNEYIESNNKLSMTPNELFVHYGPPAIKAAIDRLVSNDPEAKETQKAMHLEQHQIFKSNAQLRIMRALYSPRQLEEVMTDFWFNHFNISADKGLDRMWVGAYENTAIRPYALGKFRDLLGATCHHAAMLFYLDNWENSAANNNRGGHGKFAGVNENYARELMELHTLGVDGGYTQQDVIQLAKILTGLGLAPQGRRALAAGVDPVMGDYFDQRRHDFSDKVLLGQTIHGTGASEIEQALDLLASNSATARHISYQLVQYFVADKPPASLVRKLTNCYTQTDGNIKAMLTELFRSNEFWDPQYRKAKFKNPFRYTISVLRATEAQPTNYDQIIGFLRQQGMAMYGCLTPDGYKNTEDAWLDPDTLLKRIGFATGIASRKMAKICPQPADYTDVETISGGTLSSNTKQVIDKAPEKLKLALFLGSPDFMQY